MCFSFSKKVKHLQESETRPVAYDRALSLLALTITGKKTRPRSNYDDERVH